MTTETITTPKLKDLLHNRAFWAASFLSFPGLINVIRLTVEATVDAALGNPFAYSPSEVWAALLLNAPVVLYLFGNEVTRIFSVAAAGKQLAARETAARSPFGTDDAERGENLVGLE